MARHSPIDDYIAAAAPGVRGRLRALRRTIRGAAPKGVVETISYGIPTFDLGGKHLVHFAGFKEHVSFFPTSSPMAVFKERLAGYKTSRGTIQFSLEAPIPHELVAAITAFRVQEVMAQIAAGKRPGAGSKRGASGRKG